MPTSPLPAPSGAELPGDLVGRTYAVNPPETLDDRELLLTLRAADDPHCAAMYGGRSTCFTVLWSPVKAGDPGARGSATIVDGQLVLDFALVPFDEHCVGSSATYAYEDAGQTLRGIDHACGFPGFRQLDASVSHGVPTAFDTRTIAGDFALGMKVTVPAGWKPLHDIVGALGLVSTGFPEGPDSTWWGPDILLVEDAQIHDPSDVVSSEPAKADRRQLRALAGRLHRLHHRAPGRHGGLGARADHHRRDHGHGDHRDDAADAPARLDGRRLPWLGGGTTGVDAAAERRFIVLETGGHTLLISLANDPSTFDARNAELQTILDSITFE